MTQETHRNYLFDLGLELKQRAMKSRAAHDAADPASRERAFCEGHLQAFLEVISLMQQLAEDFDIPASDLRVDDIDPYRDLIGR
jgi:hypothetical protein